VSDARPTPGQWSDRVIEAGTLFLLVFTPLASGAVRHWATAITELVVLLIVVAWIVGMVRQWELRVELPPGWVPASLFLALVFAQVIPLPPDLMGTVAPFLAELNGAASDYTGVAPSLVPLSLFPQETWRQGLKLLAVALLFVVLYNSCRTPARIDRAVWTMILTASVIALFGVVQRMTGTGPFVDAAHFAGLVVVVVPVALALVVADGEAAERRHGRRGWLILLLVLLMGGATLVSGSRGGVVSLIAALLGMAGLARRDRPGARRGAEATIATALMVLAVGWIGSDILFSTFERLVEEVARPGESYRVRLWIDAFTLWQASPVVGTGFGSFEAAFPMVQTLPAPASSAHGESDWIQLFTDTGVLGLGLAVLAVGTVGLVLLKRLRQGRSSRSRTFALAGFVALLGAAVQGVGSYTLPIMSSLVYLAVTLVVASRGSLAVERAGQILLAAEPARASRGEALPDSEQAKPVGVLTRIGQAACRVAQRHRSPASLVAYGGIATLAYGLAYLLRFELSWPVGYTRTFAISVPLLVALRLASGRAFRIGTGRWRFVGTRDVLKLVSAASAGTMMFYVAAQMLPLAPAIPRSVILMEWVLYVCCTGGLWLSCRVAYEELRHRRSGTNRRAKRVLVVGAGESGNTLVHEMLRFPTGYRPVGFVDDDRAKVGTSLQGIRVLGTTASLRAIAARTRAQEIIIAAPSAATADLRRIVERCEPTRLPFKVLPGIAEVIAGDIRLSQLREVRIEDLLGREPIRLELPQLAEDLRGRTILVTGAAGSIGSELSRQVALHEPGRLVLFDQAETDLFYLENELRERHPRLPRAPVIGDVTDAGALERVFKSYRPDGVFHAAAYKHVPMMELNAREAVRNNVIGTWRVADAAGRHGAAKFILVSTDKAVRPVSVMGATKRLAELAVLGLQERYPATTYAAVRFGNVLGSNGSVIPIFKRQLELGKPLTVTHPEATRYFMTIPEAVQLILQAALLPEIRGRIAMLDMGEPVRIVDLAKNLLRLSGRSNGNGHSLQIVGLRPGERLHEELIAPEEEAVPTAIPKVRLIMTRGEAADDLHRQLADWERLFAEGRDLLVIEALARLFPGLQAASDVKPASAPPQPDTGRPGATPVGPVPGWPMTKPMPVGPLARPVPAGSVAAGV
jgi:FlaA1/EpsC-like NDP-sugar epimerase/O-antigen ligase